jgi:dipeptidyl aminopeptidase/acylaminoacyl peptidase
VPSTGGAAVEVTSLDRAARQETHRWPQFLPGGRRFLYFSRVASGDEGNAVMMGSLDGGDAQLVVRSQANAAYASGYLLFIRDTTLMAQRFDPDHASLKGEAFPIAQQIQYDVAFSFAVFAVSETGVLAYRTGDGLSPSHLVWFDRSGKQMGLLGEKVAHTEFSLSPDLRSIAASVLDPRVGPADLWIYDVARGLPTRFTFEPAPDTNPVWSPDGSRVAFRSRRTGSFDLYVKSFAGSENENVLLGADYDEIPESWSPDGRHLAYVVRGPATGPDIWILPLAGDSTPIPYVQTSFRDRDPAFSPDGRWIAYVSDESRRDEIYVAPFPGPGRKWQISKGGGVRPRWRGDGREIYYAAADNTITAVEVDQRGTTFEIGSAKPLFSIPPQRFGSIFRATPDGQRFLVNVPIDEERPMPLTLVVNWTADLQR